MILKYEGLTSAASGLHLSKRGGHRSRPGDYLADNAR